MVTIKNACGIRQPYTAAKCMQHCRWQNTGDDIWAVRKPRRRKVEADTYASQYVRREKKGGNN